MPQSFLATRHSPYAALTKHGAIGEMQNGKSANQLEYAASAFKCTPAAVREGHYGPRARTPVRSCCPACVYTYQTVRAARGLLGIDCDCGGPKRAQCNAKFRARSICRGGNRWLDWRHRRFSHWPIPCGLCSGDCHVHARVLGIQCQQCRPLSGLDGDNDCVGAVSRHAR
jgi:hypothetical protein